MRRVSSGRPDGCGCCGRGTFILRDGGRFGQGDPQGARLGGGRGRPRAGPDEVAQDSRKDGLVGEEGVVPVGRVDLGINARPQKLPANIVAVEAYRIDRCIIAPAGHPILKLRKPSIKDIARYPIIDYDHDAHTGALLSNLFVNAGVEPNIAVTGTDATAVMAYVEAGIGIAILQKQIFEGLSNRRIRAVDASHLVPTSAAMLLLRKNAYLHGFMYRFIELVSPQWPRSVLEKRLYGGSETSE